MMAPDPNRFVHLFERDVEGSGAVTIERQRELGASGFRPAARTRRCGTRVFRVGSWALVEKDRTGCL